MNATRLRLILSIHIVFISFVSFHLANAQTTTSIKLFDATSTFDTGPVTSPENAVPFATRSLILTMAPGDKAVISSTPDGTGGIVIDNFLTINGENACRGVPGQLFPESCFARQEQPVTGEPIETVLRPIPPIDVTALIPVGTTPVLFELRDFGFIAGNTDLFLVTTGSVDLQSKLTPSPDALKRTFDETMDVCSDSFTTSARAMLNEAFTQQITRPILRMLRSAGANPEKIAQTRSQMEAAREDLSDEINQGIEAALKSIRLPSVPRSSEIIRSMTGASVTVRELKPELGLPSVSTSQSLDEIFAGDLIPHGWQCRGGTSKGHAVLSRIAVSSQFLPKLARR
jgi:hypothetical protein